MRAGRALLAPLAAIAFLSVLAAPASASIQFDQQWGSLGILNGQFSLSSAPETQIDSGPSGPTNDASPSFGFSSDDPEASFECRLDSNQEADFQPCSSPQSYSSLTDGLHTFEVRATDTAGTDPTPASRSFTVDTAAPETQIDSGPSGPTNDATPSFSFSSEGRGELRVSPRLEPGGRLSALQLAEVLRLADRRLPQLRGPGHRLGRQHRPHPGLAQLHRRHRDARDPDRLRPLRGRPTTPHRRSASPPRDGASFECRLDSSQEADFQPCSSPKSYGSLTDGSHTFEVRATDSVGQHRPHPGLPRLHGRHRRPPDADQLRPLRADQGRHAVLRLLLRRRGRAFSASSTRGAYAACSSPKTYGTLPDGPHTFHVRAIDRGRQHRPHPGRARASRSTPCRPIR